MDHSFEVLILTLGFFVETRTNVVDLVRRVRVVDLVVQIASQLEEVGTESFARVVA